MNTKPRRGRRPKDPLSDFDLLIADIRQCGKLQNATLKKLVSNVGKPVLNEAKKRAPIGDTGDLKKSLEMSFEKTKRATKKAIRLTTKDGMATRYYKKANAEVKYINFVQGGRKEGKSRGIIKENPFAQKALNDNYKNIIDKLEKPLLDAFDQAMKE